MILPLSFMIASGWESTPNQRTEVDAYRDANILLHRETSKNYKTKLSFTIRSLHLREKMAVQKYINDAITNEAERKISNVTYWNDETNSYTTTATGFYISDPTYKIKQIDTEKNDILYESFQITMIEY